MVYVLTLRTEKYFPKNRYIETKLFDRYFLFFFLILIKSCVTIRYSLFSDVAS